MTVEERVVDAVDALGLVEEVTESLRFNNRPRVRRYIDAASRELLEQALLIACHDRRT